jgi:hypothetical protein
MGHAQDAFLYNGSPNVLKEQTNLNIEFVYEGMKVGEFTEEIYLKQKKSEFRKAAEGDKFVKKWSSDRTDIYEPKFVEQLNKGLKRMNLVAAKNAPDSKYTMLVQTKKLEPGYFNGSNGNKRDTYVNLQVVIVDSENRDQVLCTIKAENLVGVTDEPTDMKETTMKITNAYALAADKISKLITKICTQKEKIKKEDAEDEITPEKKEKKEKKNKKNEDESEE